MRRNRRLVIVLTGAALAALGGGAFAATQGDSNPRQAYLNDVARRLNVSPSRLSAAMKGALLDQIDAAVKAGRLTQAQANAMKQRIQSGQLPPMFFGPGGPRGHRLFGPGRGLGLDRARAGGALSAAAGYLGLSETQLFQDLATGKSLADVAKARGKSISGLEQAMLAAATARLDAAVAAGRLTKGEEQRVLSRLRARIADVVTRTRPMFAPHMRGQWAPGDGPPPGPPA